MSFPRFPAYGKQLLARRKQGERVGLLVVGLHDWNAGIEIASRSGVARVIVDECDLPHELDWSCAVALDCLVVGEVDDSIRFAAVTMLYAAGAASVWAVFPDGIWRLERWVSKLCPQGFYAVDGPVSEARLGRAIDAHRAFGLLTWRGVYGTPPFDAVRVAAFDKIFGPASVTMQEKLAERHGGGVAQARAA